MSEEKHWTDLEKGEIIYHTSKDASGNLNERILTAEELRLARLYESEVVKKGISSGEDSRR